MKSQGNYKADFCTPQEGIQSVCLTFINGLQPIAANLFTSIGKATRGVFLSLTRQILFLLPLIVLLPMFLGIDGVMYAGPVADLAAALLAVFFAVRELKLMRMQEQKKAVPAVEANVNG